MEEKEKAVELFDKFYDLTPLDVSTNDTVSQANNKILKDRAIAKQCALICVDEILEATKIKQHTMSRSTIQFKWVYSEFWQKVKTEIEKL